MGARVQVRSYWWEPESMLGVVGGARVLWVLTLGLWTLDLGLTIVKLRSRSRSRLGEGQVGLGQVNFKTST